MKYFAVLMIVVLSLSCNNKDDVDASDCVNVACTEEYRTITLSVKNEEGAPVVLTKYKVVTVPLGEDISLDASHGDMGKNGVYPLFSDKYAGKYKNKEVDINFKGYVGDKLVVDSNYTVGADCCHVLLIEGDTTLIVEDSEL